MTEYYIFDDLCEVALVAIIAYMSQYFRLQTFLAKQQAEREMKNFKSVVNFLPDGVVFKEEGQEEPKFLSKGI